MKLAVLVCASMAILSDAKSIQSRQSDDKTPFEFEDVIPSTFGQRGFSGSWISGTEFTYMLNGDFVKYNVESKSDEKILTKEFIESQDLKGATFRVSGDLKKVLVRYDNRQIFRHSTVSKFTIVFLDFVEPSLKIADGGEVQIAFFSPNGNGLAYIQDNDIYYLDFDFSGNPKRVTSNGVPGVIYNGIPDWVYEEEVLGTDAATWFSPNGKKMAFIQFDDTNVREAVYDLYGDSDTDQYPKEVHLRYPKVKFKRSCDSISLMF